MRTEPRLTHDEREVVLFEAEIRGRTVTITIDREAIEDHLGVESLSDADRLAFVIRKQRRIIENVTRYLGAADDIDGINVTADLLE
jgi:hypothetical protein